MRIIILAVLNILFIQDICAQVRVSGYFRKNGTYVEPHYRSSPNSSPFDNYSFPGNTNPYTGKVSTGDPEAYLSNYYKTSNNAGVSSSLSSKTQSSFTTNPYSYGISESTNNYKNKELEKINQLLNDFKLLQRKNQ
jgi:hypothetical protein